MTTTAQHYLIYSREHNAFWRPGSRGYTHLVEDAGRYALDEAIEICLDANDSVHASDPEEVVVGCPDAIQSLEAEVRRLREIALSAHELLLTELFSEDLY